MSDYSSFDRIYGTYFTRVYGPDWKEKRRGRSKINYNAVVFQSSGRPRETLNKRRQESIVEHDNDE